MFSATKKCCPLYMLCLRMCHLSYSGLQFTAGRMSISFFLEQPATFQRIISQQSFSSQLDSVRRHSSLVHFVKPLSIKFQLEESGSSGGRCNHNITGPSISTTGPSLAPPVEMVSRTLTHWVSIHQSKHFHISEPKRSSHSQYRVVCIMSYIPWHWVAVYSIAFHAFTKKVVVHFLSFAVLQIG